MGKSVLIIEDEIDIVNLIEWHLRTEGYTAHKAMDGITGLAMAREKLPDLILLDLMLPGMDGLQVCKSLKKDARTEKIPVVMLTAKGEEVDRIVGFELGADDYLVKPFSPRELLLRIKAILKRHRPETVAQRTAGYHGLQLDLDSYRAWNDEDELFLTLTEFKLLLELISNRGKVRTRDQLLDKVWGYQFDGYARTVDTHIRRLRQKIGEYADAVETVRGIGYRFKEE